MERKHDTKMLRVEDKSEAYDTLKTLYIYDR